MTTHDREQRGSGRVRRLRAALGARTVLRVAVLAGLSGIAWLAGAASAQAEPVAGEESQESTSSQSSLTAPVVDTVSAVSEQAALTPANQLESETSSILEAPEELLRGTSDPDTSQATSDADATAEVTASDAIDSEPAGRDAASSSVDENRTDLGSTLAPLRAAVEPVADHLNTSVGQTLGEVSRPLQATTRPIDAVLTGLPPSAKPSMLPPPLAPPHGGDVLDSFHGMDFDIYNGGNFTPAKHLVDASAEADRGATGGVVNNGEVSSQLGALPHHDGLSPFEVPVGSDFGNTTTGVVPGGTSGPHGPSPADSGNGFLDSVAADRDAEVSRVALTTAAVGQLPDHIADPAVSPD